MKLVLTYHSGAALNKDMVTAIRSQMAEIGVAVEAVGQEQMMWWQEGVAGNYDMTMWNTEQPYTCPHNFFFPMTSRTPHTPSIQAMDGGKKFMENFKAPMMRNGCRKSLMSC